MITSHIITQNTGRIVRVLEEEGLPASRWIEIHAVTIRPGNSGVKTLRLTLPEIHDIATAVGLEPTPWPPAPEKT